jgi:hypothetical protein
VGFGFRILFSNSTHEISILLRLACGDCGKKVFTNLQGYINHIRISHGRYFPSHSEAVSTLGTALTPEEARDQRLRAAQYRESLMANRNDQIRFDAGRQPRTAAQIAAGSGFGQQEKERPQRHASTARVFTRTRQDGVEVAWVSLRLAFLVSIFVLANWCF